MGFEELISIRINERILSTHRHKKDHDIRLITGREGSIILGSGPRV